MNVEYTLIRDLRPYPRNARTHSKKQIRAIAKSIKRFGGARCRRSRAMKTTWTTSTPRPTTIAATRPDTD
jgi:hypothetical protein